MTSGRLRRTRHDALPIGVLSKVDYYVMRNARWRAARKGLHILDYGLDIRLDGRTYSAAWRVASPSGGLEVQAGSLASVVEAPSVINASSVEPWRSVVSQMMV